MAATIAIKAVHESYTSVCRFDHAAASRVVREQHWRTATDMWIADRYREPWKPQDCAAGFDESWHTRAVAVRRAADRENWYLHGHAHLGMY